MFKSEPSHSEVIDLPITTRSAPADIAWLGDIIRAWSPAASPSTLTPGVIKVAVLDKVRSAPTSKGEQTNDVAPDESAICAQLFVVSSILFFWPMAAKSISEKDVKTVKGEFGGYFVFMGGGGKVRIDSWVEDEPWEAGIQFGQRMGLLILEDFLA